MEPVNDLADDYGERHAALDPVAAALAGRAGQRGTTDYSPAGWAARRRLVATTATRLAALCTGEDHTAAVLRERLDAEAAYLDAGLAARLNAVVSPPVLLRERLGQPDPSTEDGAVELVELLRGIPAALTGYLRTLVEAAPSSRQQAEVVAGAADAWGPAFTALAGAAATKGAAHSAALQRDLHAAGEEAAAAYGAFAAGVREHVLPAAGESDAVGADRYRIACRYLLGEDIDVAETAEWLADRLRAVRADTDALAEQIDPTADPRGLPEQLDAHPRWRVDGIPALRDWAAHRLNDAVELVDGRLLDLPPALRAMDVRIPDEPGPVRYLPPTADGSRPGRLVWPVLAAAGPTPVWNQVTMIHHEGVPGHHLQIGAAVLDGTLSRWQAHTTVPGHAEGWAVYAEGLMVELGALADPVPRFGYLMGLRANLAVAAVDLGLHTGRPLPDGTPWTPEAAVAFLGEHTAIAEPMRYFTVLRAAAWPGQALTYAHGARAWAQAREDARRRLGGAFDQRAFHAAMLGLGPCGLSVLREAAGRRF